MSVLAIGFAQGLFALDAADGSTDPPSTVIGSALSSSFALIPLDMLGNQCARAGLAIASGFCFSTVHPFNMHAGRLITVDMLQGNSSILRYYS